MKITKLVACAAALVAVATLGVGATSLDSPEAVAAPVVSPHQESVTHFAPDASSSKWSAEHLEEWRGKWRVVKVWPAIEIGTFQSSMAAGDSFRVKPGGLEYKVEYPGVIESVSVKNGWKVKRALGSSAFTITNTEAFTVRGHEWDSPPTAEIKVEGRFLDAFSEIEILKGDPRLQLGCQLDVGRVTMN